jgi:hypothetical protein
MRLMLIVVTVAMAMLLDLRVSQATQMPWCAGTTKGDFFSYNCSLLGSLHSAAHQQQQWADQPTCQFFPLNRGLGNNPTDRDAYIRYNLTR